MTNSWFILELDTTPPEIQIFAPNYTTPYITNTITIQANEELDTYQEIYVIDSNGDKVDYTFSHEGDKFVGEIKLNQQSIGMVTLYARVKDLVHNKSNLVSKSIYIVENRYIRIRNLKELKIVNIKTIEKVRKQNLKEYRKLKFVTKEV